MQDLKSQLKTYLQQANSRTWLNIGLFVFIILLVLLVVLEPGKDDKNKTVYLTKLKQSQVNKIELRRANGDTIKLAKRDDIWYLTSPYQLPANDFRAQSVIALTETKSHLQYDASKLDLKKIKLDKPEVAIVLNDKVTLEVGGVDPINNRRYVKNGDMLHLVSDTFYYQIVGKTTAYISYQLIPPELEMTKIVLPKFTLTLAESGWKLTPEQKDVSADSINEFINEWQHAQSLEISKYTGRSRKSNIQVFYKGQDEPIAFRLLRKEDSSFLVRNDLKLSYKLSDETAAKLQKLPEPPEPEEQTTDKPAE